MTQNTQVQTQQQRTLPLLEELAAQQGMNAGRYWSTIKNTLVPSGKATDEQILAVLAVARQYNLNPLTKQIYAFPAKGGGIQPIVSVDGWLQIANSHPQFDGLETEEIRENGEVIAVKAIVYRKDRSHPISATEYMCECRRGTEPWKQWPIRMLTNKAIIQAIRRAFSLAGIVDPDEGERIQEARAADYEEVPVEPVQELAPASKTEQVKAALSGAERSGAPESPQGAPEGEENDGQEVKS